MKIVKALYYSVGSLFVLQGLAHLDKVLLWFSALRQDLVNV